MHVSRKNSILCTALHQGYTNPLISEAQNMVREMIAMLAYFLPEIEPLEW